MELQTLWSLVAANRFIVKKARNVERRRRGLPACYYYYEQVIYWARIDI